MKVVVLFSGGIDSMACIYYYMSLGYQVEALFCDYGQPAAKIERDRSRKLSEQFKIPCRSVTISELDIPLSGEICGRNALLVITALTKIKYGVYKIAIGIHDGTGYADCTSAFVEHINTLLDLYCCGTVVLEAPFLLWKKKEIIDYCIENDLPINATYSCETGQIPPCGICKSCLDRKEFLNEKYST